MQVKEMYLFGGVEKVFWLRRSCRFVNTPGNHKTS